MPLVPLGLLLLLAAWMSVSDTVKVRLQCGSPAFWASGLSIAPAVVIISVWVRRRLLHKVALKQECGVPAAYGDVKWNPRTTLVYPAVCSLAGICAGLFGIGGGIVKAPLMLELGVAPDVRHLCTFIYAMLIYALVYSGRIGSSPDVVFGCGALYVALSLKVPLMSSICTDPCNRDPLLPSSCSVVAVLMLLYDFL